MNVLDKTQDRAEFSYSGPPSDPRWIALQRVLASRQFAKSARLTSFLLYIGVSTLEQRQDEITEQQIGLHVFKRPADYNPGEDNIVRTTARQLRQRLAVYYQEEGSSDEIKIDVPRGGYVPVFQTRLEVASAPVPGLVRVPPVEEADESSSIATEVRERKAKPVFRLQWRFLLIGAAFLLGICSTVLVQHWIAAHSRRPSIAQELWSTLFLPNQPTLYIPGDAGLNMYDNLARTQIGVGDYITGEYLRNPAAQTPPGYEWSPLAERRYVSVVDLQFADHLRALPEFRPERYSIHFARDLHVTDFRNANLILAGAPTYNPWIELFDRNLNFHIVYDGTTNIMRVLNRAPEKGESAAYSWFSNDPKRRGYAYIALVDNLHHDGKVLLVEGTTMAGVDAAATFLLSDPRMATILRRADKDGHGLSNFELLLEASVIDGNSPDATVIATRFYFD